MYKRSIFHIIKRYKHGKSHWSNVDKKKYPVDRALDNFDDFYGSVYGKGWKSIRAALLSEHKYVALVNNFGNVFPTIESLENDGAFNIRLMYYAETNNPQVKNLEDLKNTVNKNDQALNRFIVDKEQTEISSVYPTDVDHNIPSKLNVSAGESNVESRDPSDGGVVDYKKSLEDSLRDDLKLDERRMIDSSVSSNALHEYIPATKLKGMEDWVLESDHYKYYSETSDFPINIEMETDLQISEYLNIFSYEPCNVSDFIKPRKSDTGVLSHFLMDGASILPPIVLGVKPGDRVLDACCAPGGKSLVMLQSMYPDILVCNDIQESRVNRIRKLLNEYLYDFNEKWNNKRVIITQEDARSISDYGTFDRILVDVPCTTDRHSLTENDNNIFKPSRIKERLRIPELQSAILSNCIRLLKPGGSLVYSTCSLSPIQNDGVVHMALSRVFRDFQITATIKDLSLVMQPFRPMFKFQTPKSLKYGQQVLPYLPSNFGPMYFSKITRN